LYLVKFTGHAEAKKRIDQPYAAHPDLVSELDKNVFDAVLFDDDESVQAAWRLTLLVRYGRLWFKIATIASPEKFHDDQGPSWQAAATRKLLLFGARWAAATAAKDSSDGSATPPARCAACDKPPPGPAVLKCGACAVLAYCSAACQKAHWGSHKDACKKLRKGGPVLPEFDRARAVRESGRTSTEMETEMTELLMKMMESKFGGMPLPGGMPPFPFGSSRPF
jgi:hypothetical protein